MAQQKPVLVWVPGSFCPPDIHYADLISRFTSRGYTLVPIHLPTTGKKPGLAPKMYDDAAHINSVVSKLADEGKEVVLAGHSYAGTPMSEGMKGLSKAERERNGKKGGVIRMGYVTALVPAVGGSGGGVMGDGDEMDYTTLDEDGWLHHRDAPRTAKLSFSDVPPEVGVYWCEKLSAHSATSFVDELTYPGYKDVPVSWLFTEKDGMVLPRVQQLGIDNIESASGRKVDVTKIPYDHMPHVSAPQLVVDWMVSLVEKGNQE